MIGAIPPLGVNVNSSPRYSKHKANARMIGRDNLVEHGSDDVLPYVESSESSTPTSSSVDLTPPPVTMPQDCMRSKTK